MSNYEKQNFVSGQILKVEHLNHMEDEISNLSEEISKLTKCDQISITYSQFGAMLNGIDDDTNAVIACHNFANENGLSIEQHTGILYLASATENNCPIIKTSCDWSGMQIRITEQMGQNIIMKVEPDEGIQVHNLTATEIAQLTKQTINIPFLANYQNSICHFTTDISIGNRSNKAETYVYHETVTTDRYGNLIDGGLFREMTDATSIKMEYQNIFEKPITIQGAQIILETTSDFAIPCIYISRSNTTISNLTFIIKSQVSTDSTNYKGQLLKIANCYNTVVEKISGENFGTFFSDLATNKSATCYLLYCTGLSRFTMRDCVMLRAWGPIQTQYCKDMVFRDSTLGRIDNHYHCRNYTIENCTLTSSQSCINIGYGDGQVIINNVRFIKYNDPDTTLTNYCIHLRGEFCALYSGRLIIRDVYIENHTDQTVVLLTGGYKNYYDFGDASKILPLAFPETMIENVTYTSDNVEIINYKVLEESYPIQNNLAITARQVYIKNVRRIDINNSEEIRLRIEIHYGNFNQVTLTEKYGLVLITPNKTALRIRCSENILIKDSYINGSASTIAQALKIIDSHVFGNADWSNISRIYLSNCNIYVSTTGIIKFNATNQVQMTDCTIEERSTKGIIEALELPAEYYLKNNYCFTSILPNELARRLMDSNTITNQLNLPLVTVSDAGKILNVQNDGVWGVQAYTASDFGALVDADAVINSNHLNGRIVKNANIAFGAVSNGLLANKTIEIEKLSDNCIAAIVDAVLASLN